MKKQKRKESLAINEENSSKIDAANLWGEALERASRYMQDPMKLENLYQEAMKSLDGIDNANECDGVNKEERETTGPGTATARKVDLRSHFSVKSRMLARLLRASSTGKYSVPVATLFSVVAALLFFVVPMDQNSKPLPIKNDLDNATLFDLTIQSIQADVKDFLAWEAEQNI